MKNLRIKLNDLLSNPAPRVPIACCLDVSGSMQKDKLRELNRGIAAFFESVRADQTAAASAETAIITFSSEAKLIQDFLSVGSYSTIPQISQASGCTAMGTGVAMALDRLELQKQYFQKTGVDYYQPWLVLMTDGRPYGESREMTATAAARCREMERTGKLTVFPIAIGNDADREALQTFTTGEVLRLKGLYFSEFFQWLSASVVQVSQSRPGTTFSHDFGGMKKWRQI